ncbi:hypothetical protein G6F16_007691 [Rhizopus arrhizus]|nr:hypothetical protein G6F24_009610 [Rhizopus arrhizus]KAG0789680.1 hypothetical protein G6F21_006349 [Rhizopus arrhizus]KAG0796961.1 hypothetical protein G6F22_004800 [Rhizopus arrhizus]KAG0811379.1 hypothetical protein G6F20_007204 [Rhizopus arrhizus]KAG0830119.1 hypothetical protein G6F19_007378 [Rhizopus arrhizus]
MFSNLSATLLLLRLYKKQSMSHWTNKALAGIPLLGLSLFIAVGLDQAPNTSRLRLIYLNEQQEQDLMNTALNTLLQEKQEMILPRNDKRVVWMQEIVDNLAAAAVDDVRAPVRRYSVDKDQPQVENKEGTLLMVPSDDLETRIKSTENVEPSVPKLKFQVDFVHDNNVMNALCIGPRIFVFNLFYACTEGDTERMAVILAHEMAHTLQRHIADKHGIVKLMSMFNDIARCLLWMVTDILGPHINQDIGVFTSTFITLESETTYNRQLEKEADLVGLKLMAKAGYDPRKAIETWQAIGILENMITEAKEKIENQEKTSELVIINQGKENDKTLDKYEILNANLLQYLVELATKWFDSTHPPNQERIEYMIEHLDEAIVIYEESIRLNGHPKDNNPHKQQKEIELKKTDKVNLEQTGERKLAEKNQMTIVSKSSELNPSDTQELLERLKDWRKGICPNGTLANQACFVLETMPKITMIYSNNDDYITTEIVSEASWTDNLIEASAVTTMNDDSLIQSLSDLYMLFHSNNKSKSITRHTLHSIQIDKHAVFNVDKILRPTETLQSKIDDIFNQSDRDTQWSLLLSLWIEFGYFWPRKIMLGYKQHLSKSYTFNNNSESTNNFYHALNFLKDQHKTKERNKPFSLYRFFSDCMIVTRLDLTPLHEFFDEPYKSMIRGMIQSRFVHIIAYQPIKIFNVATKSYLYWDTTLKQKYTEKDHPFVVRSIAANHLSDIESKQYLWRLTWSPLTEEYTSASILSGFSKVYIQPACKFPSVDQPSSPSAENHTMTLSRRPAKYDEMIPQQLHFSRTKALTLLSSDFSQFGKSSWSLEYPNNKLKYVTDYQLDIKLNINEHIRRIKPLLEDDDIQLQQVGLLTAFYPLEKSLRTEMANEQHFKKQNNSKSRNNVLCIDEDIIQEKYTKNTIWKIQLPTPDHEQVSRPMLSHPKVFGEEQLNEGMY